MDAMVRAKPRWLGPCRLFFRSSRQEDPPVQPGKSVCVCEGGGGVVRWKKNLLGNTFSWRKVAITEDRATGQRRVF